MTTTRPPIHTLFIPASEIELELDVRKHYLGEQLEEVCEIAAISGSSVLIAHAGLPLDERRKAFDIWRAAFLHKLRIVCYDLHRLMNENAEVCEGIESGTMSFAKADTMIIERKREDQEAASRLRQSKKEALKSALLANTVNGYEGAKNYPTHCVVRGDGEMKLFYSHGEAKTWGQASQVGGFHLLPFEQKLLRTLILP